MALLARWRSGRISARPAEAAEFIEPVAEPAEPAEPVEWVEPAEAAEPVEPDVSGDPAAVIRVAFRSPEVVEALAVDGYARLGALLDEHEVARAVEVFAEARRRLGTPLGDAWFPTILLPDDDVRAYITRELSALIVPKLAEVVDPESLELVRLDYSVKPASPVSELGPHQDYALVDERTAQSIYLWMPLCDTGEENGTLHVVPGSHRFTNRIRSRHVPAYFDDVLDEVRDASVRLDCRAGELVVMVSGIIHWSPPNRSDELRLAAHGIVKPADVPLVFYYCDDETPAGSVECYELDIERYVRAIHQGRPEDTQVSRLEPRPEPLLGPERFRRGLAEHGPGPAPGGSPRP